MNTNRITQYQETFLSIYEGSTNVRDNFRPQVNNFNLELLAGVYDGKFALVVIGPQVQIKLNNTNLISVKMLEKNDQTLLIFVLEDDDLLSIFISFAIDLEELIKKRDNITLLEVYNRYTYWLKMFRTVNDVVSESVVKGLINELYLLDKIMIPKYGITEAINGWIGSEGTHKDFTFKSGIWYESKAINVGKESVAISSVEQLQADTIGYLLITDFESTSSSNSKGYNLYVLLNKIKKQIKSEDNLVLFYEKIANMGFNLKVFTDDTLEENSYRYVIHKVRGYLVDNSFPRITRKQLSKAINKVKYEILLSEIEKFIVDL